MLPSTEILSIAKGGGKPENHFVPLACYDDLKQGRYIQEPMRPEVELREKLRPKKEISKQRPKPSQKFTETDMCLS